MKTSLASLNQCDQATFVAVCGPLFEHSPWIAERTAAQRPFASVDALHAALCATVANASLEEQLSLIVAHPDLVGRLAEAGQLTAESTREQQAAGLIDLLPAERQLFRDYNAAYRERFGFPFVICARQNKKEAILQAFPIRLAHNREEEINNALQEIFKIAQLRLRDAVEQE